MSRHKLYVRKYETATEIHTDDEQPADEFADSFMGKIKTICDSLADHLRYNPHGLAKASLNQFTSVSPVEVVCII